MAYHHGNLREMLLERAAEVIAAEGVEALSLRGLARDLGVSHAAPRRHFEDRNALLAELARLGFRRSVEAMNEGAEGAGDDPIARYRALGRAYVEFARRDPAFFQATMHPQVRTLSDGELASAKAEWFATLRDGAQAAQRAGWHPEVELETLVVFSCSAAMGAATFLSDDSWIGPLGATDLDALADDVLALVVDRTATAGPMGLDSAIPEAPPASRGPIPAVDTR